MNDYDEAYQLTVIGCYLLLLFLTMLTCWFVKSEVGVGKIVKCRAIWIFENNK